MFSKHSKKNNKVYGERMTRDRDQAFDTSVFDDSVAERTHWRALALGGSSSRAVRQVISADRQLVRYRPTANAVIFVISLAMVCPLTLLFLQSPWLGSGRYLSDGFTLVLGIFSVIFLLAGAAWLRSSLTAIYIDLRQKQVVSGRSKLPLASVHAIQIVPEKVNVTRSTGDPEPKPSYYVSFELNLVFQDASRCNLLDHADYAEIRKSADELSSLLALPVWDKVEKDARF